jgi:hypothetical protein
MVRAPAPVKITEYSWERVHWLDVRLPRLILPSEVAGPDLRGGGSHHLQGTSEPIRVEMPEPLFESPDTFQYKLEILNLDAASIRSLVWDYVFRDQYSGEEIGRVRFVSQDRIKPGAKKRLEGFTITPPTGVVNIAALREGGRIPSSESVEIIQIRFSDERVWQIDKARIDRMNPLIGTVVPPWQPR